MGLTTWGNAIPPPRWLWEPVRQCDNPLPIFLELCLAGSLSPSTPALGSLTPQPTWLAKSSCCTGLTPAVLPLPGTGNTRRRGEGGRKSQDSRACRTTLGNLQCRPTRDQVPRVPEKPRANEKPQGAFCK